MTCEVAILNRLGLVLAADSAVTFSSEALNHGTTTYSSGANKIFQLTEKEPVGIMVFNNATLQGVPWELIIKSFRTAFGDNHSKRLSDYKSELANFIEQHPELFPPSHKSAELRKLCAQSALTFINHAKDTHPALFDPAQTASHPTEWALVFNEVSTLISSTPLPHFFNTNDITDAQTANSAWLASEINKFLASSAETVHLATYFSTLQVSNLAIEGLFKFPHTIFGSHYTGVVLAGYGNDDYFPSYNEMKYYGFVGTRLIWSDHSTAVIDQDKSSAIEAFARKSMVETFLVGAAPSIWGNARSSFKSCTEQACNNVLTMLNATLSPTDLEAIVATAQSNFEEMWRSNATETHYDPLLQIVSSLTIEEMAELAETLVMLESLKEKVTSRTQSVGGPVDVAVITKSEGLVWIKRKLFFSPDLNHRYFLRQK